MSRTDSKSSQPPSIHWKGQRYDTRHQPQHSTHKRALSGGGPLGWSRSARPGLGHPPEPAPGGAGQGHLRRLPVRRQLAFAVLTGQVRGIWGGLTERERYGPSAGGKLKAAG
jgi:hypothetical protein